MKYFLFGLVIVGVTLSLVSLGFQQTPFALGYGYGACTANRPNGLAAAYTSNYKRIELSWNTVEFEDCADSAATYRVQVRKPDASLLHDYSSLTTASKKITLDALQSNHTYQFRVKATATDDETTDWSLYKSFQTRPDRPDNLKVRSINTHQAYISWENVGRSSKLRYYQVVIKRGDHVAYSKHVRLGLHKKYDSLTVSHLKAGVVYQVKVRAVARGSMKGEYAKKKFSL